MQIAPVVVDGYTGGKSDADRFLALSRSPGWTPELSGRHVRLIDALRAYNTLRPLLAAERVARRERDQALHLIEVRWTALTSAANWEAAHHTYALAVDDARTAIGRWQDKAAAVTNCSQDIPSGDGYEQTLAAGHPPLEPLNVSAPAVAAQLLAELEERAERRRRVAAETLLLIRHTAEV